MIRIKDYIFNGNEIKMFVDGERIKVVFKNDTHIYIDATYEDIEWNYGSQERQYNEETEQLIASLQNKNYKLQDRIKELEEENKTLKELNVCVGCDNNTDYKSRNEKALEVINGYFAEGFDDEYDMLNNIKDKLKGEGND